MKKITFNLSFYNQNDTLIKQIHTWKTYAREVKDSIAFVVIDDCSKTPATDVLSNTDLTDLDISIYRVEQDLCCNIGGVRNLGATVCETEWMLILDLDTLVPEKLAKAMLELTEATGCCYKFNRDYSSRPADPKHHKIHPGVCLIRKEDYWKAGGCDEDFVGHYGHTDVHFFYRGNKIFDTIVKQDLFLDYDPDGECSINRDVDYNKKIFEHKKRTGDWSTDYLRFKWKKVL